MSTQNRVYGKKLTVNLTDGTTKVFTQVGLNGVVTEILRKLDDNPRFVHATEDGVENYYDIGSASCGFCKVASVEPTAEEADNTPCEDALPDCDEESVSAS